MFKRGFAIIMVFSIVLSTLTASYANEKTDYFNDNHVVITQSGGIYEEIQLIEGRYYYFYKDETNNKVISIDGSTKKDISIYYNNNERLYKVENYRNNKFKFGTKEYFSEIKSDILKNSNLIKLDLVSSVQIKKIIHPQNDLTDFIEVRNGDSSALEHFISNTGRGYTDNLQVAKMVGGKYVQVFESKTHSVYNQSTVHFVAGMTLGAIIALSGHPGPLIRASITFALKQGVYEAVGSGVLETYRGFEEYYKDIVVDSRTASEHQKRFVYTFIRVIGSSFTNLNFKFGSQDPYYDDNDILIQNALY